MNQTSKKKYHFFQATFHREEQRDFFKQQKESTEILLKFSKDFTLYLLIFAV